MAYDDVKDFNGQVYTGMPVGAVHDWTYPNGRWNERKLAPDRWAFCFRAFQVCCHGAPKGSGAPEGAQSHLFVLGHQRVRKVDADTYGTLLDGSEGKVAHRRSHWERWSSEYEGQTPARDRVLSILGDTLARRKAEREAEAPPIEDALSPVPGRAILPRRADAPV